MLSTVSLFCFRKYRLVISFWILALIIFSITANVVGPSWLDQGPLPGAESTRAQELILEQRPDVSSQVSSITGTIVFKSKNSIVNHKVEIQNYLNKILSDSKATQLKEVISPFDEGVNGQISADGHIAFATVVFKNDTKMVQGIGDPIVEHAALLGEDLQVEFGGYPFMEFEFPLAELIGIIAALFILLVAFGSLVAAGMPILTALVGVGTGTALVTLASQITGIPDFTRNIAMMIGIGVGIDYALFIITRYRQAFKLSKNREASVLEAMSTAGGAVLFAGITVVISLLGMLIINLEFVSGLAIGTSLAVLVMLIAALTFVPALLGSALGNHIDRFSLRLRKEIHDRPVIWIRWSEFIQKRAWFAAAAGTIILVILSVPFLFLRVGVSDSGNDPDRTTTRKAYDMLAEGFGPGFNGPLFAVVDIRESKNPVVVYTLVKGLENTKGIAHVIPSSEQIIAFSKQSQEDVPMVIPIQIIPTTSPQSEKTSELIHALRKERIPELLGESSVKVFIGGVTPGNVDFADVMSRRMPYFISGVLLLSFLLLMSVFRSILVPIKAVIMNLLSIGAAYGVLVAIFQWGWFREIFGIGPPGPIEPWAPMMLFAIVFGLSMDYEVFLLSKIKEEYDETKDNSSAVKHGLASTARVITAAALIMICVFLSFVLAPDRIFKMMGLGLAIAVFLDATIVRMILVPATMELLGDKNWWFPKWLDRIVPKIHVEGVKAQVEVSSK